MQVKHLQLTKELPECLKRLLCLVRSDLKYLDSSNRRTLHQPPEDKASLLLGLQIICSVKELQMFCLLLLLNYLLCLMFKR